MKLKSIVELASMFLGLNDLIGLGIFLHNELTPEAASIQNSSVELRRLIVCANNTIKEVAADYAQLTATESVKCGEGGKIMYNSLSRAIFQPLALYGIDGNSMPYKAQNDGVIPTKSGALKLEYSYIPESAGLFGEVICDPRITDRVLAYGTASEYALISGLNDVVHLWDRRFRDGLQAALSSGGKKKILPALKWK